MDAQDTKPVLVVIETPLVDQNFEVTDEESAAHVTSIIEDYSKNYEVTIVVDRPEMVPTAVFFSFRKRAYIEFEAEVHPKFEGWERIYSLFLNSPNMKASLIK